MDPSIIFSLYTPWNQLGIQLVSPGWKVMPVIDDYSCFLNANDLVLYCDYDEVVTVDHMANNILEHFATNADYYKQFHTGSLIWDAERYFKFWNYCDSIIDEIITATTKALDLNLSIYQKGQMETYRL